MSRVPTPVSSPKSKKGNKAKSVVEVLTPRTLSRSGRNNSPRIDYKTGKRVEEVISSTASTKAKTTTKKNKDREAETKERSSTRKRNKEKTPESSRSSTTSSPVKKDAKRNLVANDSSDDLVECTPPDAAPSSTSRSRRCINIFSES